MPFRRGRPLTTELAAGTPAVLFVAEVPLGPQDPAEDIIAEDIIAEDIIVQDTFRPDVLRGRVQ